MNLEIDNKICINAKKMSANDFSIRDKCVFKQGIMNAYYKCQYKKFFEHEETDMENSRSRKRAYDI